jgi:hypothetical protein
MLPSDSWIMASEVSEVLQSASSPLLLAHKSIRALNNGSSAVGMILPAWCEESREAYILVKLQIIDLHFQIGQFASKVHF